MTKSDRARKVIKFLLEGLDATTSYAQREPRRREKRPWRAFYGWQLAFTAKKGSVLDADGRPTQVELVKKFSASPGDIISSAAKRTGGALVRYMVQPDHSLVRI